MSDLKILPLPWSTSEDGLVFCGYFDNYKKRFDINKVPVSLSRCHKQPARIYYEGGVGQAISSQETGGRYWTLLVEDADD